ncbi:MAG: DivIVA domain-containing protein, partial [Actinobacteria bacterium]|nr:DivIVA domain-containing protein [Actinomycetota bacterium]
TPSPTAFKRIAAIADRTSVTKDSPDLPEALDKREFSVSRRGYDKKEVKAFLAEIEANFRDLEKWAEQTKKRLAIAKEKDSKDEVDEAMIAVFDAKERMFERARLQAEKIEADARERAAAIESGASVPADVDEATAALLGDAERRAAEIIADANRRAAEITTDADRRAAEVTGVIAGMIEAAQATTTPVTEESILETARAEADRLIQDGLGAATLVHQATRNAEESKAFNPGLSETEAEVMHAAGAEASKIAEQQKTAAEETRKVADQDAAEFEGRRSELDQMSADQKIASDKLAQRIVDMDAAEQEEADRARDEKLDDDDEDKPQVDDDDEEGTAGRTRYERKSAKLPSMGADASKVVGSLEGFRKSLRGG